MTHRPVEPVMPSRRRFLAGLPAIGLIAAHAAARHAVIAAVSPTQDPGLGPIDDFAVADLVRASGEERRVLQLAAGDVAVGYSSSA